MLLVLAVVLGAGLLPLALAQGAADVRNARLQPAVVTDFAVSDDVSSSIACVLFANLIVQR